MSLPRTSTTASTGEPAEALCEAPFRSQPHDFDRAPTIEGELPAALRGCLVRVGAGRLEVGEDALPLFDGHGQVIAVDLREGRARVRARHVDTPLYRAETAAGRQVRRRLFVNHPRRWANLFNLKLESNAGHDTYAWGGRLVATSDPGHFALDPATLATTGEERWSGAAARGQVMSPMPRIDARAGRLIAYIQEPHPLGDRLGFVELDEGLRVASRARAVRLPRSPTVMHDCAYTDRWYLSPESGAHIRIGEALWGAKPLIDAFRWDGRAALHLVRRPGGEEAVRVELPAEWTAAFHIVNAYDDGERVVADVIAYRGKVPFAALGSGRARRRNGYFEWPPLRELPTVLRCVIDPAGGRLVGCAPISDRPGELPAIDPSRAGRPHTRAWFATPASEGVAEPLPGAFTFFHGIGALDVGTGRMTQWCAGAERYVSQPAFAPRPGATEEGDGWVLAWTLDARRGTTEVVVLDARDVGRGPIARIPLDVHLPAASHVRFYPQIALANEPVG